MWKKLLQRGCRKCSNVIFPHSTNHIIDLWRCRHCCRRRFFDSILLAVHRTILTIATRLPRFSLVTYRSTCHIFYFYPTTVVAEKILFFIKANKVVFLAEKRLSSGLSWYEIAVEQVPLICARKTRRRDAYHRGDRFRQQANWDQNIYMFPVLFCLM